MSGTVAPCFSARREKLHRNLAQCVAVESASVGDPEAEENGEQQKWVFGRFPERFCLFDQETRALDSRLWFQVQQIL